MNGRTAKALRKALGFHPSAERAYTGVRQSFLFGQSGTAIAQGARRQYQKVKRSPVLAAAVLRAGMAGAH